MSIQQSSSSRVEYVVRYRRRWWNKAQHRLFQSELHAHRFATKLLSGGRPDLEPVVELRVENRTVGRWKLVVSELIDVDQPRTASW
jgi:hypothetical protein